MSRRPRTDPAFRQAQARRVPPWASVMAICDPSSACSPKRDAITGRKQRCASQMRRIGHRRDPHAERQKHHLRRTGRPAIPGPRKRDGGIAQHSVSRAHMRHSASKVAVSMISACRSKRGRIGIQRGGVALGRGTRHGIGHGDDAITAVDGGERRRQHADIGFDPRQHERGRRRAQRALLQLRRLEGGMGRLVDDRRRQAPAERSGSRRSSRPSGKCSPVKSHQCS